MQRSRRCARAEPAAWTSPSPPKRSS